jgi:hypothetical protein
VHPGLGVDTLEPQPGCPATRASAGRAPGNRAVAGAAGPIHLGLSHLVLSAYYVNTAAAGLRPGWMSEFG